MGVAVVVSMEGSEMELMVMRRVWMVLQFRILSHRLSHDYLVCVAPTLPYPLVFQPSLKLHDEALSDMLSHLSMFSFSLLLNYFSVSNSSHGNWIVNHKFGEFIF